MSNRSQATLIAKLLPFSFLLFYFPFYNKVEFQHVGIAWDSMSGKLWLQNPGYHFTSPFTTVSNIDLKPHRLCINSAGRTLNCRLVTFNPEHYREFVAVEGHKYYWLTNRLSYNSAHAQEYRGMPDLLLGWAYNEPNPPSFITIDRSF